MAVPASKPRPNSIKLKAPARHSYKHGLHLDLRINTVDSRTAIGKAHKALTAHLRQFVGESNVITELLLSRIVFKSLRLYLFESEELSKPLSDMLPVYLSMSNSLRRDLAELSRMSSTMPTEQDLKGYLEQNYGKPKPDDN
jgi:hypothetical protein